jgi:hypothetical protein
MKSVGKPVASRILTCIHKGAREEVAVRVGQPREEDGYFSCEYEISLAGATQTYKIAGMDGIHALQLAMFMAGSALASLPETSHWAWNGEPHTGLPTSLDQPITGLRS